MKKNDITYEYRVFTNRLVDVGSMEVGNCTSKVLENLKPKDKVDGRFFHTSDSDKWFFCWKGELQELNLRGNAKVDEALAEVEKLIAKADAAVKQAQDASHAANEAVKQAQEAAKSANEAAESIENKADQEEVDAITKAVVSLTQEVKDKADQTAVNDLAQEVSIKANQTDVESLAQVVENKASISDLKNKADKSELEGLATESYVVTKIAEAKLEGSDITIPVQDVKVNGQTVVKDTIAEIDLRPYAKSEDIKGLASTTYVDEKVASIEIPSVEGLATKTYVDGKVAEIKVDNLATKEEMEGVKTWVDEQGFLKEHQDISGKQDKIDNLDEIREGAAKGFTALQSIPDEYVTEEELNDKGYLTEDSTVITGINSQIAEIKDLLGTATDITNEILGEKI